jgi:hypothetical protein
MSFIDDGVDFVENVASDGVDTIGDGIDAITGAAKDAGDAAVHGFEAIVEKVIKAIEGGASDVVDGISDAVHKVEHAIEKAIEDSAKEIAHVATGIADGVGDAAKFVGHETQQVVDALGDRAGAIASAVFGPTVAAAVHLANDIAHGDIGHAAADTGEILLDVVGNVVGIPNAGGYVRDGIDHVPDAIDAIGSAAKAVGHAVGEAADAAIDAAHTAVDTVVGVAGDVASGDVIGAVDKVVDAIPGGNTVVHAGLDVLNAVYNAAGDATMAFGKGVMDVSDATADGVDAAVHAAGAVVDAIPGGNYVVHTGLDLADHVLNAVDKGARDATIAVGKGIDAAAEAVGHAIDAATGAVVDAVPGGNEVVHAAEDIAFKLGASDVSGAVDTAKGIVGDALHTVEDALSHVVPGGGDKTSPDGGQHNGDGSVDHATTALTSDVHPASDGDLHTADFTGSGPIVNDSGLLHQPVGADHQLVAVQAGDVSVGLNTGEQQSHGLPLNLFEEKPNPDGDGKGGPYSDVAFGVDGSVQNQDGEPGIMNVGGHEALTTTADSFWAFGKLTGLDGVGSGTIWSQEEAQDTTEAANGGHVEANDPLHVSHDAFGAELHAADLVTGSVQDQGSEHGIIIVGGHDVLTSAAGTFWDQAAGAAQGANPDQTPGAGGNIGGLVQTILSAQQPIPSEPPPAHDGPSLLDMAHIAPLVGSDGHDGGIAGAHVELGTTALHDLSHSAAAFANQLHV